MLRLGVFGGKYMTDCGEFPKSWFAQAKLAPGWRDKSLNFFGVDASQPLSEWRRKGWIHPDDPRGWFQWYCRYYMGRRMPDEDARQIRRWKAISRHISQLQKKCERGDLSCRSASDRRCCTGPMTAGSFEIESIAEVAPERCPPAKKRPPCRTRPCSSISPTTSSPSRSTGRRS